MILYTFKRESTIEDNGDDKYLKEILYFVTGATDIVPNSRGGNTDARDLIVIEMFMGREFEGVDGTNPNSKAAEQLKTIYNEIENHYYTILNLESSFGGTGDDSLNGGNGEDTYIFQTGYGNDVINDWSGNTILDMSDVSMDDIVIIERYGSDLVITTADMGDTIVFAGYKWNQGELTIRLSDGVSATINKATFDLELLNQTEDESESSYENMDNESIGEATPTDANIEDLDVSSDTDATIVK